MNIVYQKIMNLPSKSTVEKLSEDSICFVLEFKDLSNITYMNQRGSFDIPITSLEVRVLICYNDVKAKSVIYHF